MLRTRNDQPTLWESVLPEELLRLPAELARVDALLDDEAFFAPVPGVLRPAVRAAVDPDGDLPAVDVPEGPLPAGLRVGVRRGGRLDLLAAVHPHRHRRAGAAPD